jgi:NAD(P)-dependent dehydrogenase (short-subunit alcohol dehydrogenase family)
MMKATMITPPAHAESLDEVKQQFAHWRASRMRGAHITSALWAAAVRVAERHGVEQTAQALRINPIRLAKCLQRERGVSPAQASATAVSSVAPRFVELFAQAPYAATQMHGCTVEMENARGGKMRVELTSLDGLDKLASAFWSAP